MYDSGIIENSVDKDDANLLRVIFVSPVADENWFYKPRWHIDYRAPSYLRNRDPQFTKPYR